MHATPAPARDGARLWAAKRAVAQPLAVSAAFDAKGRLWLARVKDGHVLVSVSPDEGRSYSAPVRVNPEPEAVSAEGENRPKIAVAEAADGKVIVHVTWTVALERPYAGHIRYSRSRDDGASFDAPITLNDDRSEISHRFDALAAHRDHVTVVWLDARDRKASGAAGMVSPGASLYFAASTDGGAHFGVNRRVAAGTCECCRVSVARRGAEGAAGVVALWRHLFPGGERDFALGVVEQDSTILRVSDDAWAIDGCPHHGGAIAVDEGSGGKGGWHIVWYTQGKTRQGLFYRRVEGERLSPPIAFGDDEAQAGHPSVIAQGGAVFVAWREFDGKNFRVNLMRSADRGSTFGAASKVAESEGGTDYPMLISRDTQAFLVWNTERDGLKVLRVGPEGGFIPPEEVRS